jgi:VWFA-related protein
MIAARFRPIALTLAIAGSCVLLAAGGQDPQQQPPLFRSGAKTVAVFATVTESGGRMVPDLVQADFEIRDSGKPQPITVFSNEVQPISVVLMLDRSGSMRQNYRLVEAAGEAFVSRLLPGDKARIGTFADKVDIAPEAFTSDKQQLVRLLRAEMPVAGATPLWNGLDAAITALAGQDGRRVVLVFSDGYDNPQNFRFDNRSIMDVMRRAQQENVMVYAVGLQSTLVQPGAGGGFGGGLLQHQRPDPSLGAVADDTGGGYFELNRAEDLAATFARVADELHHQYALGFEPQKLDDKMHKLEVKVTKRGMKVRARKEYFAAK